MGICVQNALIAAWLDGCQVVEYIYLPASKVKSTLSSVKDVDTAIYPNLPLHGASCMRVVVVTASEQFCTANWSNIPTLTTRT